MEDMLRAVKTAHRLDSNLDKFEALSVEDAVSLSRSDKQSNVPLLEVKAESRQSSNRTPNRPPSPSSSKFPATSVPRLEENVHSASAAFQRRTFVEPPGRDLFPEDARDILRASPSLADLSAVLEYLQHGIDGKHAFNIRVPGPKASQVISALVTTTIPDFWPQLRSAVPPNHDAQLKETLVACLRGVGGIGALLMQIKQLVASSRHHKNPALDETVSLLSVILVPDSTLQGLVADAVTLFENEIQRRTFWQELTSFLAGSKVLSVMSQVFAMSADPEGGETTNRWLGDGPEYCKWLARNISMAAKNPSASHPNRAHLRLIGKIFKRSLGLGYRDALVAEVYISLLLGPKTLWSTLNDLVQNVPPYDQKAMFDCILRDLARKYLGRGMIAPEEGHTSKSNGALVGGVAAIITGLVETNHLLEAHLVHCLATSNTAHIGLGLDIRRATIAALAPKPDKLCEVLEKSIERFGNKTLIQHEPIAQQEATAQTLLLAAGRLSHANRASVASLSSSSIFLRTVSSRLSASAPRARFLGMIVAVAISRLVDKSDTILKFDSDEMEGEEAQQWLALIRLDDQVGDVDVLRRPCPAPPAPQPQTTPSKPARPKRVRTRAETPTSKIVAIEELPGPPDDGDEDGLVEYPAPDSDASDSDDDPSQLNRHKPTAPVYITSLIKQLNASDDPYAVEVALRAAPSLIRRKANFGDELSANVVPLASTLLNLQDNISAKEGQQWRLEALIACLVAQPAVIGPWLASMYLEGDFSLSQRATLLTAIGLGGREMAGIDDEVAESVALPSAPHRQFPSERLPQRLESEFGRLSFPIKSLSTALTQQAIEPLAISAADQLTGPNVLKIRTFSSRMAVAAKAAAKQEARTRRIPRDLHRVLAQAVCLPLCSRLTLLLLAASTSPHLAGSALLQPALLRLNLQTLVILVSTIGPYAVPLGELTHENLLLLTALHALPSLTHDPIVLPPLLQLLLTLLDLNIEAGTTAQGRLVTDWGPMIAELVAWAAGLGERVSIPEVGQDDGLGMGVPWPVLVAAIQVRWEEVGRRFQGRMFGLMARTERDAS